MWAAGAIRALAICLPGCSMQVCHNHSSHYFISALSALFPPILLIIIMTPLIRLSIAELSLANVFARPTLSDEEMAEYAIIMGHDTEALSCCLETRELQELNKR
ncbi:hypothetical protein CC78DRAFT_584833 [Lojkania enalia]|uniref:Uncharacterized protein n=1 Tax=Lojkania enalia TaxID=147567 RepID=A0A9P4N0E9_9PLEO|nr:hypothetical protein CC78DRAFT_584833 [Didymosphaeria enalia]